MWLGISPRRDIEVILGYLGADGRLDVGAQTRWNLWIYLYYAEPELFNHHTSKCQSYSIENYMLNILFLQYFEFQYVILRC